MPNAREVAYISLERCEKHQKYSNLEIDAAIEKYKLTNADKSLFVSLVYGVIERKLTLDFIISVLASKPLCELDLQVLIPIRLALYQIIFMDKIPKSAAVNESVKLSLKTSHCFASFTNAVLRSFLRECDDTKNIQSILNAKKFTEKFKSLDKYDKLSVIYSYPKWLCEKLCTSYGEENAVGIMNAQNGKGSLTLRVNTLKTSVDKLLSKLTQRGIKANKSVLSPFGINLESTPISEISDILKTGEAFVQDEASQLAAKALGANMGDTVIDACACPGGKSFSVAILMQNNGKIISCDIHKSKLSLIKTGAQRLGIDIITTLEANSSQPKEALADYLIKGVDRVLCDVPCSGLGVIAKKPEIRYKNKEDIDKLPDVQLKILENCSKYVKPSGKLVYSTCTINPDENENNIQRFLKLHNEFKPVDFDFGKIQSQDGMITLFPHIHNTDGFFISVLEKVK